MSVSRRIAFFGMGNMGLPMARNVAQKMNVVVFDSNPAARDKATAAGLKVARSQEEAVADADTVISMLPSGPVASKFYIGEGDSRPGLLKSLPPSTDILDCSTIDAVTAKRISEAAAANGLSYFDTPVSGGVGAAAAGTLAFMIGGPKESVDRIQPVLATMGPKQFHAGPSGSGQIAKAFNNMLLAIHMIGTSEALSMGARSGLDPAALSEIFKASSGRNWSVEVYNPYPGVMPTAPSSNDYAPGFMVDLMCKDLGLALDIASESNLNLPMGELASSLYTAHQSSGKGQLDFSSICQKYLPNE